MLRILYEMPLWLIVAQGFLWEFRWDRDRQVMNRVAVSMQQTALSLCAKSELPEILCRNACHS